MKEKINYLKLIMNEFIIYRMEEELNLISCLIKQNEDKINNNKININFFYKNKCSSLKKEKEEKELMYENFINNINDKRIKESEFKLYLDEVFSLDEAKVKRYCFFLQSYFASIYTNNKYEERNKINALNDIKEELKLDENILEFIKKSIKKNIKIIDNKNIFDILTKNKMGFDIETFYPLVMDLFSLDLDIENSLLSMFIVNKNLEFIIPNKKGIIDIDILMLKKYLFSYLLVYDFINLYSLKNYNEETQYVSSLLKYKNEYEKLVLEKQIKDDQKEEKLILLNKVTEELVMK